MSFQLTTPAGLRPVERLALEALSKRHLELGYEMAFVAYAIDRPELLALTDAKRQYLWALVDRYRRQLPGEVAALGTEGQKLLAAEREGYAREGLEFELALHDNPDDWDLRRVYADHFEEQGEEVLAAGQRWQVEHRTRPVWYLAHDEFWWFWLFYPYPSQHTYMNRAVVPPELWWGAAGGYHPTRRAAERALAEALNEVQP